MYVLQRAQGLVDEKLAVVIRQLLVRLQDGRKIRFHKLGYQIHVGKRLFRVRNPNHCDSDDVLVL
jgi:hypothetical protein